MADRIDWANIEPTLIFRKACRLCRGEKFIHLGTRTNGDGTAYQHEICAGCSTVVRWEVHPLPRLGIGDIDDC